MGELGKATSVNVFATPMLAHLWADAAELNGSLRDSILAHEQTHAGMVLTNVGGWHSETGRLEFCGAAGERLIGHMQAMTEEATRRLFAEHARPAEPMSWTISAWANVNRSGDFNKLHSHWGATWSGVYYVDPGHIDGDKEGTPIYLSDPAPARTNTFFPKLLPSNISIRPVPGLMILFPGYLQHGVQPHRGDRPRISVTFNVRKEPFP
jgi:uncharacterized protein (TIGR02466 family)